MIRLTHPVTRHEVRTDEQSADFWRAAGYVTPEPPKPAAKRAPRRTKKSNG